MARHGIWFAENRDARKATPPVFAHRRRLITES
jgi:hypothetical protein